MKKSYVMVLTAILTSSALADETVLHGKQAQDAFFAGTRGVVYSEEYKKEVQEAYFDPIMTPESRQILLKFARIAGIPIDTCDDGGDAYIASLNRRVVTTRTVDDEGKAIERREAACTK